MLETHLQTENKIEEEGREEGGRSYIIIEIF